MPPPVTREDGFKRMRSRFRHSDTKGMKTPWANQWKRPITDKILDVFSGLMHPMFPAECNVGRIALLTTRPTSKRIPSGNFVSEVIQVRYTYIGFSLIFWVNYS